MCCWIGWFTAVDDRPVYGFTQPGQGLSLQITSRLMTTTRRRLAPGQMRAILAENVGRRMEERYWQSRNKPLALAKEAKVSLSTVQRMLSKEQSTTIDTVEAFAGVFGLPAFQLLVPWGLLGKLAVMDQLPVAEARLSASRRRNTAGPRRRDGGRRIA